MLSGEVALKEVGIPKEPRTLSPMSKGACHRIHQLSVQKLGHLMLTDIDVDCTVLIAIDEGSVSTGWVCGV